MTLFLVIVLGLNFSSASSLRNQNMFAQNLNLEEKYKTKKINHTYQISVIGITEAFGISSTVGTLSLT